jgi:thiol-disulfide isomerase/thioredoxin
VRSHARRVRIVSGAVIALVAVAITFNLATPFQTLLPGYTQTLQNHVEYTATVERELHTLSGTRMTMFQQTTPSAPVAQPGPGDSDLPILEQSAPPIIAGGQWFNSKPLTIAQLHGKVVLVDFWTYSCINCLRTIPHLEAWYDTYAKYGLVIIGVHSPEFAFEHVASNVAAAIKRLGITYPVVQDNDFATWYAYDNESWPSDYLIDQQGRVRAFSEGEGGYAQMQSNIAQLLGVSNVSAPQVADRTPTEPNTAEAYLGYVRLDPQRYVGGAVARNRLKDYPAVKNVPLNSLAYSGSWDVEGDVAVAGPGAGIALDFQGKDVYMVLGGRGSVRVTLQGRPVTTFNVTSDRLYTLVSSPLDQTGALVHVSLSPGVQAYSFTFG